MFTDIVGFSAIAQRDEALALKLLDEHQILARGIFPDFGAREVKTIGDAFMLEFSSALDAVECGVAIQVAMHDRNAAAEEGETFQARIGVHLGDVVEKGGDLFGDGVNIAARVEPLSPHGGIAVSQQVYDQVVNKLELGMRKMSTRKMKNIERVVEVYEVIMPWEAVAEAPPEAGPPPALPVEAPPAAEEVPPREEEAPAPEALAFDKRMIAVLPLVNELGEERDEFISDSVTEALIMALSPLARLKIISWDSAIYYKKTEKDLRTIGQELRAGTLVKGSVKIIAGQLDLDLAMVEPNSQSSFWTRKYISDLRDVPGMFVSIAREISKQLGIELHEWEASRIERQGTSIPQARIFYLKARNFINMRNSQDTQRAIDFFMRALMHDSAYALAHVGIAEGNNFLGLLGRIPPNQLAMHTIPGAWSASQKALELDPFLAEAHASLGTSTLIFSYDIVGAQRHLKQAVEFKGGCAGAHQWYALALAVGGRFEECMVELQAAAAFDPASPLTFITRAMIRFMAREYAWAIEIAEEAIREHPQLWPAFLLLGMSKEASGDAPGAVEDLNRAGELSERNPLVLAATSHALATAGKPDEARGVLAEMEALCAGRFVSSYYFALGHLGLKEYDKALTCLEQAYDEQLSFLMFMNPTWLLDPIRSHERFEALFQKTGLPPFEAQAASGPLT